MVLIWLLIILNHWNIKNTYVGKTADVVKNTNSSLKNAKMVVSSKYFSNFWKSLEMLLINYKTHLELNWIKDNILSNARDPAKLEITDAKLHVPIVNLSTKDYVILVKQLSEGFKRSVYWISYQDISAKVIDQGTNIYELLSAPLQGVRRLFVLAYVIVANLQLMKQV